MLDLTEEHAAIVLRVLDDLVPACDAWVFGSRAVGPAKPHSDLDLVLVGERLLEADTLAAVVEALSESDLPFKVDVLDWHATPAWLQQRILRRRTLLRKRG